MRITFLIAALDNSGGVRVLAQYAHGLMRLGHEVLVVSPAPRPYGRRNRLKNFIFPFGSTCPDNHFERLDVPIKMLKRHRKIQSSDVPDADFIVATWWETAVWLTNFPVNKGKQVHFVQGYEIWNGQRAAVDAALKLAMPKITISQWLATILYDLGVPVAAVIPNGVDHNLFLSKERKPPSRPKVGFVYSEHPLKGADIAIQAIQIAQRQRPELQAIIFGHTAPQTAIIGKNMAYVVAPPQERLSEIYSSCNAWLFPSREEGYGLPILEAMACGTPVIACPSGAAPEIIRNGGGVILNSYNPQEMATEIINLIDMNEVLWSNMSSDARSNSQNHNWDESVKNFEDLLNKL